RHRLPDGGVVEVLGGLVAADGVPVGVELDLLRVDVERQDVEVTVQRQDLALQQAGRRRDGCGMPGGLVHSSPPPLASDSPWAKCGSSLLSNMLSAEPM